MKLQATEHKSPQRDWVSPSLDKGTGYLSLHCVKPDAFYFRASCRISFMSHRGAEAGVTRPHVSGIAVSEPLIINQHFQLQIIKRADPGCNMGTP